jgi:hypothetical protein
VSFGNIEFTIGRDIFLGSPEWLEMAKSSRVFEFVVFDELEGQNVNKFKEIHHI